MHRERTQRTPRGIPDWFIGLLIAIVIVVGVAIYLRSIGAGDDPAFESDTSESSSGVSFALAGSSSLLPDLRHPIVIPA